MLRGMGVTVALCVAFVVWTEGYRPIQRHPRGRRDIGPDLSIPKRHGYGPHDFYATTIVTALVFYLICWAVAWGMRKLRG